MALIECKNCHKTISDKATKCLHCGYDRREERNKLILGLSLYGVGIVFLVLGIILKLVFLND